MRIKVQFILSTIAFSAGSITIQAQSILTGTLYDSITKQPIPFVNIYLEDAKQGTSSNEKGEFSMPVRIPLPVRIIVSHVNYEKKNIVVSNTAEALTIHLTPLVQILNEVLISGNNPLTFVYGAYEKLSQLKDSIYTKSFYRQWSKNDDVYTELVEKFYTSEINPKGLKNWKLSQGRYAVREDVNKKNYIVNNNFSFFTKAIPVFQYTNEKTAAFLPLRENADEYFDFKTINILTNNKTKDNIVVVIKFTPKENIPVPGFKGELYIDSDYNLVKFIGLVDDPRFSPLNDEKSRKMLSNISLRIEISFDQRNTRSFLVQSINVDLRAKQKNGNHGEFRNIHVHSFFFNYDVINTTKEISSATGKDDFAEINSTSYDEAFWDKNNVLKETPLEKAISRQFKKTKSFGRMFQN